MLNTLHQDKQIIVLNKQAGVSVLNEGWDENALFLKAMLEKKFGRIWVVHRLDKVTSGVIVFARNAEAHRHLNTQFEKREVDKTYHAIVEDYPEWNEYTARHSLHVNVGRKHRTVVDNHRGKPSETDFKVIKQWHPVGHRQAYSMIEAKPKTGRTHQIRVHLSTSGLPIVADILYGAEESDLIARAALHAYELSIEHPVKREKMTFTAPYPEDFKQLIDQLDQ
ncbi:MAG: RluA family pseudouridine synthase [Anaerolineae bacterium]|jgi:RluA family pseudouridine synthase|nr:RluA family pseudouridine synthase [Anaerolineae bacterium]MBT7191729.1 RluA family pseudouridine synthase [Anaerolineae bacterium]MBT7990989.1 RluA family pseudouridine synthase [Anaerolineae bacterium]